MHIINPNAAETQMGGGEYPAAENEPLLAAVASGGDSSIQIPDPALTKKDVTSSTTKGTSFFYTVFNLAHTIVGCGILTLPFACSCVGLGAFMILLVVMGLLSLATLSVMVRCSEAQHVYTFKELAQRMFGRAGGVAVELTILVYSFGASVSFAVILGDYTTLVFAEWLPGTILSQRWFCVLIIAAIGFGPLSLARRLEFLRHTSLISMICVAFAIVVAIVRLVAPVDMPPIPADKQAIVFFTSDFSKLFVATPLISVAFAAQYNVQTLYKELRQPTPARMDMVSVLTTVAVGILYGAMAFVGYLTFRGTTPPNILRGYPATDILANLARLGMAIVSNFSYPFVQFPCRLGKPFPNKVHVPLCLGLVALCVLLSIVVPDMAVVLDLTGSLAGSAIVYIFPALFAYRFLSPRWKIPTVLLGLVGLALAVLGCRSSILHAIEVFGGQA
ncbi:Transmembrane amino acid transporter [Paratrimastix pyriformis]|uniref:Transmembrane amino acid transporter n=1 Tax=Paratrimastix pyriformis TaxID=342808 RepID=A0ABQ8UNA0_9EUKA|nr:Transmembrane amino acid transporter [Paratrimastix pyriformis]